MLDGTVSNTTGDYVETNGGERKRLRCRNTLLASTLPVGQWQGRPASGKCTMFAVYVVVADMSHAS